MSRFGSVTANFFLRTNLATPVMDSAGVYTRVPISGFMSLERSGEGRGEVLFAFDERLSELVQVGRVLTMFQTDAVLLSVDVPPYPAVPFGFPIVIETVELVEPGKVRVAGPDLLSWLKDVQVFRPIGASVVTNSTVAVAVADPAAMTLSTAADAGATGVKPSSMTGWQVGDEARIELSSGLGTHVTVVTALDNADTLVLRESLPAAAGAGNGLERRRRQVQVGSGHGGAFVIGAECRLTMDNNSVHETLIEAAPDGDIITMQHGAPDGAAVGKAITATSYTSPTTGDVNAILSYVGWSAVYDSGGYTGTANGTYHAPKGDSVYDLLVATAARSGEFFRLREVVINPVKQIVWRRSADYAGHGGSNLRLVMPDAGNVDSEAANINRGIITGGVRRVGRFVPVTRVIPYAGDDRITLKLCSNGARALATAAGATLVDTGLGLYTPSYVRDAAAETTWGVISRVVNFSDIRAETDNTAEWQTAADSLLMATLAHMKRHGVAARYQYEVENVVCPLLILPGQRVELVWSDPTDNWSVNKTGASSLYVESVRREFASAQDDGQTVSGGIILTSLTLLETPDYIPDVVSNAAEQINSIPRLTRTTRGGATGRGGGTTTVVTGGSGSDHGALTGLGDDDHPHYLRTDGTRTLLGNMAAAEGVLIDGVDLSAHAANPDAHHPAVVPANTGVFIAGQSVGVNLAVPSALEVNNGLRLAAAVAGNGLLLSNQVLSLRLAAASGMVFSSGALTMGTPGALSAAGSGGVTATGHTHAVSASSNPGAASQLLKTDASGYLQLLSQGVGVAPDGASGLKVMSPQPTWVGLLLKKRADQVGQLLRLEDASGAALLLVTNDGNLESGNPGFVSGVTGFQIQGGTGNAEFNNVIVRGELRAVTFTADEMHAAGGTLQVATATVIAEPYGAYDNDLGPIDSSATTYITVNGSLATGLSYFAQKDIIHIQHIGEVQSGGSLYIPDIYLEVVAVAAVGDRNMAEGKPGRYTMTCLRKSGGYTGYRIPVGAAVVLHTKSGQGTGAYKGGLRLTADLPQSPYLDIYTVDASRAYLTPWPGSGDTRTLPEIKPRVRLGNLDGVLGLVEQWGIAAGADLSDTSTAARYIVASELGVTLRNVDLSVYSGASRVVRLATDGLTLLNGSTTFPTERSIRWLKANGANVAALGVRGDEFYHLSLGLRPTFADVLAATGIDIYEDPTASGGDRIDLKASEVGVQGNLAVEQNMSAADIKTNGALKTGAGLTVGSATSIAPTAAIRLTNRGALPTVPAGFADLYVDDAGGVQHLYIKFAGQAAKQII